MTLRSSLRQGEEILALAGIEEAGLDAWLLLEHTTGVDRARYYADPDIQISGEQQARFCELIRQRASHIPLQFLTGEAWFCGLRFKVNEHVLIPRQDTETLVEEALKLLPAEKSNRENRAGKKAVTDLNSDIHDEVSDTSVRVLDMCTGSGCIIVSLKSFRPDIEAVGADLSEQALKVARENAAANHTDVYFVLSDMFQAFDRCKVPVSPVRETNSLTDADVEFRGRQTADNGGSTEGSQCFDLILSNPPYIRSDVIPTLMDEVKLHEPHIALDGGADGLEFYRILVRDSGRYLKKGGHLAMEIGYDQGGSVSDLLTQAGFTDVRIVKDLAGMDRVAVGSRSDE